MQAHPGRQPRISCRGEHASVVIDGGRVVPAGLGLDARPLDRETVVRQTERGEQREVLGVPRREAVALTRDGSAAGPLPVPPVGRRRGAFALRRRCGTSPHEPFRPSHTSPGTHRSRRAAPARRARPPAADGCGSTAARDAPRDERGEQPSLLPGDRHIVASMHHQRRRLDQRAVSRTSMVAHDSSSRAAFAGEVVRRSSSAKASHSSTEESGMNRDTKNRRKPGSPSPSRAAPSRTACSLRGSLRRSRLSPAGLGSRRRPGSGG